MIRILWFSIFVICSGVNGHAQPTMQYENRNQVDYGPLVVRTVTGIVFDNDGVSIPDASIGVFTEATHALVSQTRSDSNGSFTFKQLSTGEYRLVIQTNGLCSA